ncbi:MAG: acyltransferase [Paludibacteraceae bacterium]|nr:acyltransferase [Paludibacteraceae bacterium]
MNPEAYKLSPKGYDAKIAWLKGLSIIFVILTHNISHHFHDISGFVYWGDMAVPLFLCIQAYHVFKRENNAPHTLLQSKTHKRIIIPFLCVSIALLLVDICHCAWIDYSRSGLTLPYYNILKNSTIQSIKQTFTTAGLGTGSYYFWIWLQFALLMPLCHTAFKHFGSKKLKEWQIAIIMIVLCEALEIFCSLCVKNPALYRVLCFRYVFLIYGGYLWARHGVRLTPLNIVLSAVSIIAIFVFYYKGRHFNILFYPLWKQFHWICYFYVFHLLAHILIYLHERIPWKGLTAAIERIGDKSYEIYLWQSVVFYLTSTFIQQYHGSALFVIATTLLCLIPAISTKRS